MVTLIMTVVILIIIIRATLILQHWSRRRCCDETYPAVICVDMIIMLTADSLKLYHVMSCFLHEKRSVCYDMAG